MIMDVINCIFYLVASALIARSIYLKKLGVHWSLPLFYGVWCLYSAFNFAVLDQPLSAFGVLVMCLANIHWLTAELKEKIDGKDINREVHGAIRNQGTDQGR